MASHEFPSRQPSPHEQLWAPWRLDYVAGAAGSTEAGVARSAQAAAVEEPAWLPGADVGCFLCRAAAVGRDRATYVLGRFGPTVVVLNRYPYNNGHLLISPQRHEARLDALSREEQLTLVSEISRWVGILETKIKAQGFNVGLNLGHVAGAGVPGHLHWHIVPRWGGDTNFMPAVAGVRVIPQSLDALWTLLVEA